MSVPEERAAKLLVTAIAVCMCLFNLVAEVNSTHVWNATIEPHARFHLVWQLASNCSLAVIALALLWQKKSRGPSPVLGSNLRCSVALLLVEPLSFLFAAASRTWYGGTYFPANVPEYDITLAGMPVALLVFGAISLTLLLIAYFGPPSPGRSRSQ
jgi:hypothetical protein